MGGSLASTVYRSLRFRAVAVADAQPEVEGSFALREAVGSNITFAEQRGGAFEVTDCNFRHVTFSKPRDDFYDGDSKGGALRVAVFDSMATGWWFGMGFKGEVTFEGCRIIHIWNDAEYRTAKEGALVVSVADESQYHGIYGVKIGDGATPFEVDELTSSETRRRLRGTDYRRPKGVEDAEGYLPSA